MNKKSITYDYLETYRWLWRTAFSCFIIAGLTGALYRFGMFGWLPQDISLQNIRHAHSHLMFFGWAVPLPLLILLHRVAKQTGTDRNAVKLMRGSLWGGIIFGILSYPFFLIYGYHSIVIGSAMLPLSVILSGLVMVSWYGYMGGYIRIKSETKQDTATPWYEASLVMLFISSLGAWGVAVLQVVDPQSQLFAKALTHFFLSSFTEGWVVLVVLAVLFQELRIKEDDLYYSPGLLIGLIAIGAPLTFPYGISESLLTPLLLNTARIGGLLASAGLLFALYELLRAKNGIRSLWIWSLGLFLLKALMQLGASVIPSEFWLSDHMLRILYLHVLLLGVLTLSCVAWVHQKAGIARIYFSLVYSSVGIVLFSLIMMTRFWPATWNGMWVLYIVTGAALLPVLAMTAEWYKIFTSRHMTKRFVKAQIKPCQGFGKIEIKNGSLK